MLMIRRHLSLAIVLLGLSAHAADTYTESPGKEGDGSFTIGPGYKIDPDLTDRGNAKGKTFVFKMALAESKISPGTDKTLEPDKKPVRTERKITVYEPAAYKNGTNDNRSNDPEGTYNNWVMAGLRTEAALAKKGYAHRFILSKATGHCDKRVFEQTLADTLVWIWRGYRGE
jgi:hypothetical protein